MPYLMSVFMFQQQGRGLESVEKLLFNSLLESPMTLGEKLAQHL